MSRFAWVCMALCIGGCSDDSSGGATNNGANNGQNNGVNNGANNGGQCAVPCAADEACDPATGLCVPQEPERICTPNGTECDGLVGLILCNDDGTATTSENCSATGSACVPEPEAHCQEIVCDAGAATCETVDAVTTCNQYGTEATQTLCEEGFSCKDGACQEVLCGNGVLDEGELCDGADVRPEDDCNYGDATCIRCANDCTYTRLNSGQERQRLFGDSVAVSGDLLVVGNSGWRPNTDTQSIGQIQLFRADGEAWAQEAVIDAPSLLRDRRFGRRIVAFGDTIAVGDPIDDTMGRAAGSLRIYRPADGVWSEVAHLLSSDATEVQLFGMYVAAGDGWIAVSDGQHRRDQTRVRMFAEIDGVWTETMLDRPEGSEGLSLGEGLALDGSWLVVGAPPADDDDGGRVFVYQLRDGTWRHHQTLDPSQIAGRFGDQVALHDGVLAVGVRAEDEARGAVYVYELDGDEFALSERLQPDFTVPGSNFGAAVAVDTGKLVVGAPDGQWGDEEVRIGNLHVLEGAPGDFTHARSLAHAEFGATGPADDDWLEPIIHIGATLSASDDRIAVGSTGVYTTYRDGGSSGRNASGAALLYR
jgi:hypothetical protein